MRKKKILIVEDSPQQLQRYCGMAKDLEAHIYPASTAEEAIDIIGRTNIDILLSDIHLTAAVEKGSFEGFDIIRHAIENHPEVLPIVMSSDPKINTYDKAMKIGAAHFIKKPIIDSEELKIGIDIASERFMQKRVQKDLKSLILDLPQEILAKCEDGIVLDQKTRNVCQKLAKAVDIVTVIYGESGTGKEEVAKLIHKNRVKTQGKEIPFVAVNCASIDSSMANSQLFGHIKGAYTGSVTASNGLIGEANGGILFLDEIHCLPEDSQRRLLRVLNDGSYQRLGDTKTLYAEFQVIVASTKDLDDLVDEGKFLIDLRTRLTGIDIELHPLRQRKDDIDILIPLYIAKQKAHITKNELDLLIAKCKEFYWQGNIRQLVKVIHTLVAICQLDDKPIEAAKLPIVKSMFPPSNKNSNPNSGPTDSTIAQKILDPLTKDCPLFQAIDIYEKNILEAALKRHKKLSTLIESLEISRSNLDKKRKKYNLE